MKITTRQFAAMIAVLVGATLGAALAQQNSDVK